jgi:GR25 family glycosyltransferase involved in LPS biosynthesis
VGSSPVNKYFDKVFCINLYTAEKRWKTVSRQFKKVGIDVQRFVGVDGRCKNEGSQACLAKLRSFELQYDVDIPYDSIDEIDTLLPAASLTIGTILLLRAQVRNGWKRILIFEDDVEFVEGFNKKFAQGVKEIGKAKWDALYLGCGAGCGFRGIREGRDRNHRHPSWGNQYYGGDTHVSDRRDLRSICEEGDCKYFSEHITQAHTPKGTWSYGVSLAGAKKILNAIDNASEHIDQLLSAMTAEGTIRSLAFDFPIVMHVYGAYAVSIPWEW